MYLNKEELAKIIHMTGDNITKRLSLGLPMPPSLVIPNSRVRLWKEEGVYLWLDDIARKQADNKSAIIDMESSVQKVNSIRKKGGRPRKKINTSDIMKMVANM